VIENRWRSGIDFHFNQFPNRWFEIKAMQVASTNFQIAALKSKQFKWRVGDLL